MILIAVLVVVLLLLLVWWGLQGLAVLQMVVRERMANYKTQKREPTVQCDKAAQNASASDAPIDV